VRRELVNWLLATTVAVPQGAVALSPEGSIFTTIPQRSGYYSTPPSLTGQVVCSRGRVHDLKRTEARMLWFDGETGDPRLAGWRCVQLH
jgi:hypothetical protein